MFKRHLPFLVVILSCLWLWRIAFENIFVLFLTIASITSLYVFQINTKKNSTLLFLITLLCLVVWQINTTPPQSLTNLDNDEQRIQQNRIRLYPPTYIQIGDKTLWLKFANWFEQREEAIAFFRIERNFFQAIDPSLYFFVNHPRERVGVKEFEKLPYILLPLFIFGTFTLFSKRNLLLFIAFFVPIFISSIWGNNNPLSNFSLLPALIVTTSKGLEKYLDEVKKLKHKDLILKISIVIFILIFIQTIIYTFK